MEAHRLSQAGDHQHVVAVVRQTNADELVVLAKLDRDDPVGSERRVVRAERRLLDNALARGEHEVLRLLEVPRGNDRADVLVLPEREEVHDRATLGLPRAEGKLVHLEAVHLPDGREEQDVVMGRRDEEVLDVVVLLQVHAHDPDTSTTLLAVRAHG